MRESQGGSIEPWQGAVCGAIAGGVSAGLTTPLDVAKTRIMLAKVCDFDRGDMVILISSSRRVETWKRPCLFLGSSTLLAKTRVSNGRRGLPMDMCIYLSSLGQAVFRLSSPSVWNERWRVHLPGNLREGSSHTFKLLKSLPIQYKIENCNINNSTASMNLIIVI